jgi:hypothetical protein
MRTINATLFATATSLNAFWILNIAKEAYPAVKTLFNFYPVTGPLLGLYIASIAVFCISYVLGKRIARTSIVRYYLVLSALFFFLGVFAPVYGPIVRILAG